MARPRQDGSLESVQEGAAGGGESVANERPEWLPEKFTSPEELARSYGEAERRLSELAQQKAQVEQNFNDLVSQMNQQPAASAPQANEAELYAWYEQNPLQASAFIAQQAAQQAIDQRLQQFVQEQSQSLRTIEERQAEQVAAQAFSDLATEYEDIPSYEQKMLDELRAKPWLLPSQAEGNLQGTTEALRSLYELVKARDLMTGSAQAQAQQEQERQRKLAAQTATGSPGRIPSPGWETEEWERIKNAGGARY